MHPLYEIDIDSIKNLIQTRPTSPAGKEYV
jgi:hypothetical protein